MANFCRKCGHKLLKDDNFCPNCGFNLNTENINKDTNSSDTKLQENIKPNRYVKFIKYLYQIPTEDECGWIKFFIYIIYPLTFIYNLYDFINYFQIYINYFILTIFILAYLISLALMIYHYHILSKYALNYTFAYYAIYFIEAFVLFYIFMDYGPKLNFIPIITLIIILSQKKKFLKATLRKNTYYDYQQRLTEITKDFNPEQKDNNN